MTEQPHLEEYPMKTAKEILKKHYPGSENDIIEAMQEYALQACEAVLKAAKKEAKKKSTEWAKWKKEGYIVEGLEIDLQQFIK